MKCCVGGLVAGKMAWRWVGQGSAGARWGLAFTRYCHYQYRMPCIAIQDGQEETHSWAIVWAMQGGWGAQAKGGVSE